MMQRGQALDAAAFRLYWPCASVRRSTGFSGTGRRGIFPVGNISGSAEREQGEARHSWIRLRELAWPETLRMLSRTVHRLRADDHRRGEGIQEGRTGGIREMVGGCTPSADRFTGSGILQDGFRARGRENQYRLERNELRYADTCIRIRVESFVRHGPDTGILSPRSFRGGKHEQCVADDIGDMFQQSFANMQNNYYL